MAAEQFKALGYTQEISVRTRNRLEVKNFQSDELFTQDEDWKTNDGYLITNIIDLEQQAAQEMMMMTLDFIHIKHMNCTSK